MLHEQEREMSRADVPGRYSEGGKRSERMNLRGKFGHYPQVKRARERSQLHIVRVWESTRQRGQGCFHPQACS